MVLIRIILLFLTFGNVCIAVYCPENCNCFKNFGLLDCSNTFKTIIPDNIDSPKFITELVLRGNQIKQLNVDLHQYSSLTYFDISSNGLINIEDNSFEHMGKLHTLIMRNNLLSNLNNKTLYGLKNLVSLDLSQNHLTVLLDNTFQYFPKLLELNLTGNFIHSISGNAFSGLYALDSLHLTSNRLMAIPVVAFKNVKHLRFLNLEGNNIHHLLNYSFCNNSMLADINIANNDLKIIEDKAFSGLENSLESLDLHQNYLPVVPTQAFLQLEQLSKLDLGANRISVIASNSFYNLSHLEVLYLNDLNDLTKINGLAFNLTHLRVLHIAFNPLLRYIHPKALYNLPALKVVYLNNNGIHKFPKHFLPWENLETLDMSGNFIDCDCDAQWLLDVFNEISNNKKNFIQKSLRCRSPKHLLDLPVSTLKPSDFHCHKLAYGYDAKHHNKTLVVVILSVCSTVATILILFSLWHFRVKIFPIAEWQSNYTRQKNILTDPQNEEDSLSADTVA
ncbi:leucine-rich repeat neuronal protein 2-like [Octopus sinensis]|uniref:Leucine-rich repeat neuronal protein 2-like n=1 Tax=Octopus sinensis TaxID=2607531 RepID=A0A6P7TCH9_9MOLL|nr:leucine-rich repeat neuronal protein 2-like [Octopus sinensis]